MVNLLIMGKPGAGKGTQATRLLEHYRLKHISTGNVYPFAALGSGGPTETVPPGPVGEYAMSWVANNVITELRQAMFARIVHLPMRYFSDNLSGHLMSRVTGHFRDFAGTITYDPANLGASKVVFHPSSDAWELGWTGAEARESLETGLSFL